MSKQLKRTRFTLLFYFIKFPLSADQPFDEEPPDKDKTRFDFVVLFSFFDLVVSEVFSKHRVAVENVALPQGGLSHNAP